MYETKSVKKLVAMTKSGELQWSDEGCISADLQLTRGLGIVEDDDA